MGDYWYKWMTVLLLSMIKFLGGPISGLSMGLSLVEIIIFTIAGMMCSVVIFSLAGTWLKNNLFADFQKNKKVFSKKKRNIVKVWKKYGLNGVAFLTPLVFTPILGTMIVVSFGVPLKKIIPVMFISAVFWALLCTIILHYTGSAIGIIH